MSHFILPNWPAPQNISALTTTCASGNLALHVEDDPFKVRANRQQLIQQLQLPAEPIWLDQTHSTRVNVVEEKDNRDADAAVTRQKRNPLVILTADCLPILLCDQQGTEIAAVHAGWKGLLNGILQNTLQNMQAKPAALMAWIGPAICVKCYEVGEDVKNQFITRYPFVEATFKNSHANLALMAEKILNEQGVLNVYPSEVCSFEEKNRCYSYRRASQTGRMATLIWFNAQ